VRLMKMIGLAALAAAVVMAFAAAGSASAAVKLCKKDEKNCAAANTYALPQAIHAQLQPGTVAVLHAGPIEDECEESLITGTAKTSAATELVGLLETTTFNSCTCEEQKLENLPYKTSILPTNAAGESIWHITSDGTGVPAGLVKCGGLSCLYEKSNVLITALLKTSGLPLIDVNTELTVNGNRDSGFACLFGGNAHWEASYEITKPDPVFITE
jgi:hypothetical protein